MARNNGYVLVASGVFMFLLSSCIKMVTVYQLLSETEFYFRVQIFVNQFMWQYFCHEILKVTCRGRIEYNATF